MPPTDRFSAAIRREPVSEIDLGRRGTQRTFIVPDVHSNVRLTAGLLREAGVPALPEQRREAGVFSVQLGDLANCVLESGDTDAEIIGKARDWFDVVLVGNH